jgi:4-amino-4-deoxy-L-arabinose transferase-like glycosyltransferase
VTEISVGPIGSAAAAGERSVPRFAGRLVWPIAAVVALVHLATSFSRGYWFDEVYMLAIGRYHLDWGSADQPPVAPALAALADALAPGSVVVLRLPAVLATAAAVVVAALIARELGGDARAQAMTAGAQATALWTTLAGHWLTPYTLEPVQWLLLFWVLVRWLRLRDDRLLLLLGLVAGIAAQTKFQVLLLCGVMLLAVAVFGPRELLRRPLLWAGAAIGAAVAAPTLVWQALNDWPQLRMGPVVAAEADFLYGGRPGVAATLIFLASIAGTVLALYGLWRLLRAPELRTHLFLGVTAVVLYVFFVVTVGRPYYLGGLYGLLAAVGALGLQRRREAGRRRLRWVVWPAFLLSTAAAVGMLMVAGSATSQSGDVGAAIARRTAALYRDLPPEEQPRTAVIGGSYIVAAYLDGYAPDEGLPPANSLNRGYGYFRPPPESQDAALYIGGDPVGLRPYFTDVRRVAEGGPDASAWLLTGRTASWTDIWTRLRHLTVG